MNAYTAFILAIICLGAILFLLMFISALGPRALGYGLSGDG